MESNPSRFSKTGTGSSKVSGMDTSKFPVECVSWDDAQEFCRKLSAKDGQTYRLPTEAEWEYACRPNTTTPFHFGSTLNGDKANVNGNFPYGTTTKGKYLERTTTVGTFTKNDFGLYDMHGNVWEWCEDMYDDSAYGKRSGTTSDPKVTSGSTYRVLRGGSWAGNARNARSANRSWGTPDLRYDGNGFRVVSQKQDGASLDKAAQQIPKLAFTLDELIPVLGEPDQKGDNSFLYRQTLKATQTTGGIDIAFNSKDTKGLVFAAGLFSSQLFTKAESKQIVDFIDRISEEKEIGRFKVTVSEATTPQGWRQVRFSPKEAVPELPSKLTKAIWSKSTGMKLTLIPSGTFQMGSSPADVRAALQADSNKKEKDFDDEQPQHSVRISQSFYMGVYEVTQEEYESVMGSNPSGFSQTGRGKSDVSGMDTSKFPVAQVSWNDAVEFCRKLSAKDGQTYRLPTEAEWEYACRANTTTPFHFGSTLNGDKANVNGNYPYGTTTKGKYLERMTTVGTFTKNDFGLYDMHGNVWEWCEDVRDESAYGKRTGTTSDPKVTTGSQSRVVRGGCWVSDAGNARAAYRHGITSDVRANSVGFRVMSSSVRTP